MPDQYLTEQKFDTWAARFENKLDRVIEKDQEAAILVEGRLVFLETYQKQMQNRIAWVSGIAGSVVAAIVTSILTWLKFGK